MKEKIIAHLDRKLELTDRVDTTQAKRTFFDQAFGALVFAMECVDADLEAELIDIWTNKYKPAFERKVYGV